MVAGEIRRTMCATCSVWGRSKSSRYGGETSQCWSQLTGPQRNFGFLATLGFVSIYMATWEFVLV